VSSKSNLILAIGLALVLANALVTGELKRLTSTLRSSSASSGGSSSGGGGGGHGPLDPFGLLPSLPEFLDPFHLTSAPTHGSPGPASAAPNTPAVSAPAPVMQT